MSSEPTMSDEAILAVTGMAMEAAAEFFAKQAEELAESIPAGFTGREALAVFAETIRKTNRDLHPRKAGRA